MAKTIGLCAALNPEGCPASDFTTLHSCSRPYQHDDGIKHPMHECLCSVRWLSQPPPESAMPPSAPKRDLVDLVKRIAVTEVQPGDVLVFETDTWMSDKELKTFREGIREGVSDDVRVMVVEHAKFAGVLRHAHPAEPDDNQGAACRFLWRDEHNPTGSDHRCNQPVHTGLAGEHQCNCGATRLVTLNDVPAGMAETTSLSDLARGRRSYLPTRQEPPR
jgi:hypothetical protein